MAQLVTLHQPTQSYLIQTNKISIGSHSSNDIVIPNSQEFHCEIRQQDNDYWIIDKSYSGTFLFEYQIGLNNEISLKNGDKFLITNPKSFQQIGFTFYQQQCENIQNNKEIICTLCMQIMRNPVIVDCGHYFCLGCITKWQQHTNQCPVCTEPLYEESENEESDYDESSYYSQSSQVVKISQYQCRNCAVHWKGFKCTSQTPHQACNSCGRLMPSQYLNENQNELVKLFCQICFTFHCKYYYGDCRDNSKIELAKNFGKYLKINDLNPIEQERILAHLNGQPLTTIFDFVQQHYIQSGLFFYVNNKSMSLNPHIEYSRNILPESPICWNCCDRFLIQVIVQYVQAKKLENHFKIPNCPYGINCKLQDQSMHASMYIHLCPQIKFD